MLEFISCFLFLFIKNNCLYFLSLLFFFKFKILNFKVSVLLNPFILYVNICIFVFRNYLCLKKTNWIWHVNNKTLLKVFFISNKGHAIIRLYLYGFMIIIMIDFLIWLQTVRFLWLWSQAEILVNDLQILIGSFFCSVNILLYL